MLDQCPSYPLISVLIPVYNVEKFVFDAVKSILNQTYKNLEIIIIDDCSTDDTYKIVEELAEQDNRIRLYKNRKNLNIVKTLNFALTKASGELIARMDGDDISAQDRIQKQYEFLLANPNIALVGCSLNLIDQNGDKIGVVNKPSDFNFLRDTVAFTTPVLHIWLAKSEVYECLEGYRELPYVEDLDFLLRMITAGFEFSNVPDYFGYSVRVEREGNTASTNGLLQLKMHDYAVSLYKERINKGRDTFSLESIKSPNRVSSYLFYVSTRAQNKVRQSLSNKNYILAFFNFISIFISYSRLKKLLLNIVYKIKFRRHLLSENKS